MTTKAKYRNGIYTLFESSSNESMPIGAPILLDEEFLGTTLVAGTTIWTAKDTHANAIETNIADQHGGVFGLHIDLTEAEMEAGLTMGDQLNFNLDKGFIIEYGVSLKVLPTLLTEAYWGVGNNYVKGTLAAADQGPTVHAMFMADGTGAITIHTDDASTDNDAVATGVTVVAEALHVYKIDFTTITNVLFYIDGVRVASGTTFSMANGTNVVVQPYMMLYKSAGAGLGDVYIDYVKVWGKR